MKSSESGEDGDGAVDERRDRVLLAGPAGASDVEVTSSGCVVRGGRLLDGAGSSVVVSLVVVSLVVVSLVVVSLVVVSLVVVSLVCRFVGGRRRGARLLARRRLVDGGRILRRRGGRLLGRGRPVGGSLAAGGGRPLVRGRRRACCGARRVGVRATAVVAGGRQPWAGGRRAIGQDHRGRVGADPARIGGGSRDPSAEPVVAVDQPAEQLRWFDPRGARGQHHVVGGRGTTGGGQDRAQLPVITIERGPPVVGSDRWGASRRPT